MCLRSSAEGPLNQVRTPHFEFLKISFIFLHIPSLETLGDDVQSSISFPFFFLLHLAFPNDIINLG